MRLVNLTHHVVLRARIGAPPHPQVTGVTITSSPPSPFQVGQSYDIAFTCTLSDGSTDNNPPINSQFSSDNPAAVTVDQNGHVSAVAAGSATITWRIAGIQGTIALTASTPTPTVASIDASPSSVSISDQVTTAAITAAPRDSGGNLVAGQIVTAGSSNTAVATVSISGYTATITYQGAGSAIITLSCGGFSTTVAVTSTTIGSGSWVNLVVGSDKAIVNHPGDLTSSTQRQQIATFAAAATPVMQTFTKQYWGTYWAVAGGSINVHPVLPSNGGMEYYSGAVVRMNLSIAAGEAQGGTYYTQAMEIAQNYRDFLQATWTGPNNMPGLHWCLPETLLMLVNLNNDAVAKNLLNRMARWSLVSVLLPNNYAVGNSNCEGRLVERVVKMCLCAHKAGLGSAEGVIKIGTTTYVSWLALAVDHCDKYIACQLTSGTDSNGKSLAGAYNWGHNTGNPSLSYRDGQGNFHVALVYDAIWKVHLLAPKQAYLDSLALACTYLKNTQFVPDGTSSVGAGEAFFYQNRRSDPTTPGLGGVYYDNTADQASASNIDITGIFAGMFYRNGDITFARRLLGINLANQFGSPNSWCGSIGHGLRHLSDWTNTTPYTNSPALGGYDTICKRYNEQNMHIWVAA